MPTTRRVLSLPPNGHELAEIAAKEFQAELLRFFRAHLAYPNASIKIQWTATFYCTPGSYSGEVTTKVATEGLSVTQLEEQEIEQQVEMSSIEIGVPSPATSPVLTRQGIPSTGIIPAATESKGRRDINARRSVGEAMAGQGSNVIDNAAAMNKAAQQVVADLEVSAEQQPLHDSTIVIPEKL